MTCTEKDRGDASHSPDEIERCKAVIKVLEKCWYKAERESDAWAYLAQGLAIELECLLSACEDTCAQAAYWTSAQDAIASYHEEKERILTGGDPEKLAILRGPNMLGV